jgi:plasmid replication initiation protein
MPTTDLVAVKHNALVSGKYNLGLVEQRVMLTLISKIDSTGAWDGTDGKYTIDFGEVLDFIDNKNESKRHQMMEATDNLLSKVVHIRLRDMDDDLVEKYKKVKLEEGERPLDFEKDEIQTNWVLPPLRYTFGHDELDIKIDKFLMPFLIEIKKNFTKIPLDQIMKLHRSKYSPRCFEIISRYAHQGKVEIKYQDLREMLGIEEKAYQRFTNFRDRVLRVAVKDILENTNLNFEMKINKRGRKVVSITFDKIKKTKQKTAKEVVVAENQETTPDEFYEMLKPQWEADLNKRGVVLHKNYEKEGLKKEHWEKALLNTELREGQLVVEAKKIRDQVKEQEKEHKKKETQDELIKKNKRFWEDHHHEYKDLSPSEAYIHTPKGVVLFVSPTFEEDLKPHKKTEVELKEDEERRKELEDRRGKKNSLISGTSLGKRTKGRRKND